MANRGDWIDGWRDGQRDEGTVRGIDVWTLWTDSWTEGRISGSLPVFCRTCFLEPLPKNGGKGSVFKK